MCKEYILHLYTFCRCFSSKRHRSRFEPYWVTYHSKYEWQYDIAWLLTTRQIGKQLHSTYSYGSLLAPCLVTFLSSAYNTQSLQNNSIYPDLLPDEMDLLYSAYGDDTGVQCALRYCLTFQSSQDMLVEQFNLHVKALASCLHQELGPLHLSALRNNVTCVLKCSCVLHFSAYRSLWKGVEAPQRGWWMGCWIRWLLGTTLKRSSRYDRYLLPHTRCCVYKEFRQFSSDNSDLIVFLMFRSRNETWRWSQTRPRTASVTCRYGTACHAYSVVYYQNWSLIRFVRIATLASASRWSPDSLCSLGCRRNRSGREWLSAGLHVHEELLGHVSGYFHAQHVR